MYREDRSIVAVHTAKLDALNELVERAAGDPMLRERGTAKSGHIRVDADDKLLSGGYAWKRIRSFAERL